MDTPKKPEIIRRNRERRQEAIDHGKEVGGLVLTFKLGEWVEIGDGMIFIQVTKNDRKAGRKEIRLRFVSDQDPLIKVSRSKGPR